MALRMRHHLGAAIGRLRVEPTPVRVRALAGGRTVVDSVRALLVWEPRRLVPVYAVPVADVAGGVAPVEPQPAPPDLSRVPPMLGPEDFGLHTTPGRVASLPALEGTAAGFLPDDPDLDGVVVLDFAAFDAWMVEDEALVGHPHDPFKRIDVLDSSREVEVRLHAEGPVLARSTRARMLVETHLPVRWYVPPDDVRLDLLVPSETVTTCAYKGHAAYLSTTDGSAAGRDVAWRYEHPLDDAVRVRDHVCFWSERTHLRVDGVEVRRPVTPWSTPAEQAGADPEHLEFG